MGDITYNGWQNANYAEFQLTAGDNTPDAAEYLVLIPAADGDTVSSIGLDEIIASDNWLAEIANGDQTQTMTLYLIGGQPGQTPPQLVLPPGFTKVQIPPGFTQRIAYIATIGAWVPLFNGTLVV